MGCRISLTNRNLVYGDINFGDGSLNGFILNGVETIYEIPKDLFHGNEIVQTTTSQVDGLCKSKCGKKICWALRPCGFESRSRYNMKNINKEEFIKVCNKSLSMAQAAQQLNLHFNTFKRYALKFNCYKPNQSGKGMHKTSNRDINVYEIIEGKHPQYQTFKLKNKLFKKGIKERKCECCGLSEWNNLPIPLELHHIDGDRTNHKLENLQILCLNCHAQTETFRAKNIK